jgi:2-alkyl-3-oxoalkanoate reductase
MRVFVAGATGALGRQLVPRLVAAGHEIVGTTRSREKFDEVRALGARPAAMDGLDPDQVGRAVSEAEPEVIVHELTALSGDLDPRKLDQTFAVTNRLRTEGTDHLLSAAKAAGVRRFVAQSFAGWQFARVGGRVKTEDDPVDTNPPPKVKGTVGGILYVEQAVTEADWVEGLVLRYGGFYGPGTSLGINPDGEQTEAVRKRRFPIVGSGDGIMSLIQIEDAASATAAAVERGEPGVYNVVDDDPAPVRVWLPGLADALGAKPPRRVPLWLGRMLAGEGIAIMMTELRGASNEKAKREFDWSPRYPSWREGFAEGLG